MERWGNDAEHLIDFPSGNFIITQNRQALHDQIQIGLHSRSGIQSCRVQFFQDDLIDILVENLTDALCIMLRWLPCEAKMLKFVRSNGP